jgi:hypothetical protein
MATTGNSSIGGYNGFGFYQTGSGGEFTFKITDTAGVDLIGMLGGYANGLSKNVNNTTNTFQSFCVEESEYVYAGETMDVVLNQKSELTGKTLTMGVAWLYQQFATGGLAAYGYNYSSRSASQVQELQTAIWYFMGELTTTVNNAFTKDVFAAISDPFAASNGAFGVWVLNTTHNGSPRQDMLVYVPDGGLTALLLGIGVGALALFSRKLR